MNIFAIEGDLKTGKIDWIASGKSQDNYRVVKMIPSVVPNRDRGKISYLWQLPDDLLSEIGRHRGNMIMEKKDMITEAAKKSARKFLMNDKKQEKIKGKFVDQQSKLMEHIKF